MDLTISRTLSLTAEYNGLPDDPERQHSAHITEAERSSNPGSKVFVDFSAG